MVRHSCHTLCAPEEYSAIVSGLDLSIDFLKRRTEITQVEQFQTNDFAIDFGKSYVKAHVRGGVAADWASLCFVEAGDSMWRGLSGRAGALLCAPPGEELDGCIAPGFGWITLAIPLEAWRQCQQLAGAQQHQFQYLQGWQLPDALSSQIRNRLRALQNQLSAAVACPQRQSAVARKAGAVISQVAVAAWEMAAHPPLRDSQHNRAILARRARTWMLEHHSKPVLVPEVCLALHVSRRELEYAFRATFDQSPSAYLKALRLNAVRRSLLQARPGLDTVSGVAAAHGITHFGRFAAQYQALFGETPHYTLRGK